MVPGPGIQVILAVLRGAREIGQRAHRVLECGFGLRHLVVSLGDLALQLAHADVELDPVRIQFTYAVERNGLLKVGLGRNGDLDAPFPRLLDEVEAAGLLMAVFLGGSHVDAPEADLMRFRSDNGLTIHHRYNTGRRGPLDRRNGQRAHPRKARGEEVAAEPVDHLLGGIPNRGREHLVACRHVDRARLLLQPLDIFGIECRVGRIVGVQFKERIQPLDDL